MEEYKKISGIYKITSPTNKVYVGQAVDLWKRYIAYRGMYSSIWQQRKIFNSIKKYGFEAHLFEVLEACDKSLLNIKERYYQDLYKCVGDNGLNCELAPTDLQPKVYSKETLFNKSQAVLASRLKIDEPIYQFDINGVLIHTFKNRTDLRFKLFGITSSILSKHFKANKPIFFNDIIITNNSNLITKSLLKSYKQELKTKFKNSIVQYDLQGNKIKVWDNCFQINDSKLFSCLIHKCQISNRKVKYVKEGYIFKYQKYKLNKKDIKNFKITNINKHKGKVYQYHLEDNILIKEWDSLKQIITETNMCVGRCLYFQRKSLYGYRWLPFKLNSENDSITD